MCADTCGSVLKPHISPFFAACCCCLQLRTLLLCVYGSLLRMFGHDVRKHLCLHQQECGSAAAAPTARMRRVQQPMLHVSSSISRDCATIRVGLCAGTPYLYVAFVFLLCLLLLRTASDTTTMSVLITAMHVWS